METQNNNIQENIQTNSPWYRCSVATAIISASFSLIVLFFLLLNYGKSRVIDTEDETKLLNLRSQVYEQPENEELLSQVRVLDLEIRQRRFRAVDRSRKGGYLLFGGVVVLLTSIGIAGALKKKLPMPQLSAVEPTQQVHEAKSGRWAVTAGTIVLGLGALLLAVKPSIDFAGTGEGDASAAFSQDPGKNWPSFRGPEGLGVSAYTNIPTHWDGKTGEGIRWKTKIPLPGNNSPIVWGNRIFLTGGDPNELAVFCFDTDSGKILWKGDVTPAPLKEGEEPLEPMEDTGWAAPTAVTDGERVYAIFVTGDIAAFDFDGKKIWQKKLDTPENAYGHATSLAIYRNTVLIQYDQGVADDGLSKMIALDGFTGDITWQTKRPVDNSWSSPVVVSIDEEPQVLTCSAPYVIAYEPTNGTEIWRADCMSGELAPSPIYADGLVFVIEPYNKLVAIKPDGKGDVTETHIAWEVEEGGPDICSPVSDGERIYMLGTEGFLTCQKTSDGKKVWEHDIEEFCLASPSLVGDKIYVLTEKGDMFIIKAGDEYKELARCELGEKCHASPAFLDGRIYIRGVDHLYCIEDSGSTSVPAQDPNENWPSFRGPEGLGVSAFTNIPTQWDGKTGEGILWKAQIPLPGHNSPIVWGNRAFLTGGDPNNLAVFCFDTDSGKQLWRGDLAQTPLKEGEEPLEPMEDTGWAAPTAVTDGERVYAIFVTGDIAAFDFNGKKIWQKNLGTPENAYGHATSLAIYQNLVLIQYDQGVVDDGLSKMIALDGSSGAIAWQKKRPVDNSWSSPTVVRIGDQSQLLTVSSPMVIAYDPAGGTELWRVDDFSGEMAPSPIYANGLVFVIEPYNRLVAIKPDGKGDVTKTHVAWSVDEGGPDICSPVSDGERIYMLGTEGFITCHKTSDGENIWEHDLEEFCLASPSLVGDKIYVLSEKGLMFIFEAGDEYKELARCELGEKCHATPAFLNGRLYIRGVEHLYCIGSRD